MNAAMKHLAFVFSVLCLSACGGGGKPATTPDPTPTETTPAATEAAATTPTQGESTSSESSGAPAEDPKQAALQAELAAYETAKPVFEKFCSGCHEKGKRGATKKALGEFEITAYPFTGEHANGPDIRKVLGIGGGKATMPRNKPGAVKGDDLAAITAWLDAWDAAESAGAHAQ
jgi:hypothetical protein